MLVDIEYDTDLNEIIIAQFEVSPGEGDSLNCEFVKGSCTVLSETKPFGRPIHVAKMTREDLIVWGYYEACEDIARLNYLERTT